MPSEPAAAAWPCICRHASARRGKGRATGWRCVSSATLATAKKCYLDQPKPLDWSLGMFPGRLGWSIIIAPRMTGFLTEPEHGAVWRPFEGHWSPEGECCRTSAPQEANRTPPSIICDPGGIGGHVRGPNRPISRFFLDLLSTPLATSLAFLDAPHVAEPTQHADAPTAVPI